MTEKLVNLTPRGRELARGWLRAMMDAGELGEDVPDLAASNGPLLAERWLRTRGVVGADVRDGAPAYLLGMLLAEAKFAGAAAAASRGQG